jgi:acyl-CoA reductase-like NAD-dependent aldehyde dehydrogenase
MDQELDLDKVDILRERAGLSYRDAVEYLERAKGDVVKALVFIEEDKHEQKEVIAEKSQEALEKVKEVVRKGNEMKIKIDRRGEPLIEVPVTVGVIGTAIAPYLALAGAAVALATGCSISVKHPEELPRFEAEGEENIS